MAGLFRILSLQRPGFGVRIQVSGKVLAPLTFSRQFEQCEVTNGLLVHVLASLDVSQLLDLSYSCSTKYRIVSQVRTVEEAVQKTTSQSSTVSSSFFPQ